MAVKLLQVTIGAAATRFTATHTSVNWAVIQADDGNANPVFIGPSGVTSATGIRLNNSATVPESLETSLAFSALNLEEFYAAGTDGEKVNVLYDTT